MVERLKAALQSAETLAAEEKVISKEDALVNVAEAAAKVEGKPELAPGTQHVGKIMSAKVTAQTLTDVFEAFLCGLQEAALGQATIHSDEDKRCLAEFSSDASVA